MLPPDHPLSGFELRPVIDWIELRVVLPSASQFQHVQQRLRTRWGKTFYVKSGDPLNHSSHVFTITIHDPTGPDQAMQIAQSMVRTGDPAIAIADVCITAVEIALDAYPRNPADCTAEALAMVAHHLHRHHARPPAGVPRICEPKRYRAAARPRDNLRALTAGWSINAGERSGSYASRAYAKTHDTRDGEQYKLLPVDQHRARFEITLRGEQLPFTDLAGWWAFPFETLARRFALRRSTTTLADALLHLLGLERAQLGRPDDPAKRAAHRRQRAAATRADRLMNDAIRVALRRLTRHQKCGNSDRFSAAEVAATEEKRPATGTGPRLHYWQ